MTEKEGPRLIGEVFEKRAQVDEEAKSVQEAKKQIPSLRNTVQGLMEQHFEELNKPSFYRSDSDFNLDCTIPNPEGDIKITVRDALYGLFGGTREYILDVEDLDYLLKIKPGQTVVESKSREHEELGMNTPIGVPLESWPSWSREANTEDIQKYSELLDHMLESDTKYTPHTHHRSRY